MPSLTSPSCPSCHATVEAGWVACPRCASALSPSCGSCGQSVQSGWVACPFCGSALGAPPTEQAEPVPGDGAAGPALPAVEAAGSGATASELSVLVFNRIEVTLVRERDRLVERINRGDELGEELGSVQDFADDLASHVARDVNAYAARMGFALDVREDEVLRELAPFAGRLGRALDRLAMAVARAKEADIPTTQLDGIVQGAQIGLIDSAGYAAAGAMIGSVIPVVGTFIGGAAGGWYASQKRQREIEGVVSAYERAYDDVAELVDAAERPAYAAVAKATTGLLPPADLERIVKTALDWCSRIDERLEQGDVSAVFEEAIDDEAANYRGIVLRILNTIGNHLSESPEVRSAFAEGYLDGADEAWWAEWDSEAEHYHYDPVVLEVLADHWAYLGEGERALQVLAAARAAGGAGAGVEVSEARAHAVNGDHQQALTALDRAEREGGATAMTTRFRARSLAALGDPTAAARVLADAAGLVLTLAGIRAFMEEDGTESLLNEGPLKSFYSRGRVRAMAKAWLTPSDKCLIAPSSSDVRVANAVESYVADCGGGTIVVLLDHTVWGSAKNGVVVTEKRLMWRPLWEDAMWLDLPEEGHGGYAEADGSNTLPLFVGGEEIALPCPEEQQPALARLLNALG